MANFVLGTTNVMTETNGNVTVNDNVDLGEIKTNFDAPDTSSTNLQNTSMVKNTALPIFACRAFCVFDGTNVDGSNNCQLYASGNILKVVRESTGHYKVYFQNNMPDAHYCVVATGTGGNTSSGYVQLDSASFGGGGAAQSTTVSTFNLRGTNSGGTYYNHPFVHCAVFR
tara:strand:+ start:257 stop:766 length:510 start_codon:yes stop_codon:yes gene_type:complete